MNVQSARDKIHAAEPATTINEKKHENARKFTMMKPNEALISGISVITVKGKRERRKKQIFAIRKENCKPTSNRSEVLKIVEGFHGKLFLQTFSPKFKGRD